MEHTINWYLHETLHRKADSYTGYSKAHTEPHAAARPNIADDLWAEARAPTNSTPNANPHAPKGPQSRMHRVPSLIPPKYPLYDHPDLQSLHLYRRYIISSSNYKEFISDI